jgi:hypothetical protein
MGRGPDKKPRRRYPPINVGDRFGLRVVVACSRHPITNIVLCDCVCDCGQRSYGIAARELKRGFASSCGCVAREKSRKRATKHGLCKANMYDTWKNMIDRCTNPNHEYWDDYGGRGITVCKEWLESIQSFYADMGERPAGMTLERIRNNEGYCKANCIWASRATQSRNRRGIRIIEYAGKSMCLKDWADELGIKYHALFNRLKAGWSVEKAFTQQVRPLTKKGS